MSTYLIDGQCVSLDSSPFPAAWAAAHATRRRPLCLCTRPGPEMYVARLGSTFTVKRMPSTGRRHDPTCPSFEASPLPSAAMLHDASGKHERMLSRLLDHLWEQAGLARWDSRSAPQSWPTVRKLLLAAAERHGMIAGRRLEECLYIPEAFYPARRDALAARRTARWSELSGKAQHALLLGELKRIIPTRLGPVVIVKHVPDQRFRLHEHTYRRLMLRFRRELLLWTGDMHMIVIATLRLDNVDVPTIEDLTLVPVNANWTRM